MESPQNYIKVVTYQLSQLYFLAKICISLAPSL